MQPKNGSAACFDDVLLVPQYSEIGSRKDINLDQDVPRVNVTISLPIVSSPMDTVTGSVMAAAMSNAGGFGIIHRYNTIEEQVDQVFEVASRDDIVVVGAAIGASGDYLKRACDVRNAGASVICVDIAHGHHILMERALKSLRDKLGDSVHLMAGNVATLEGFNDLADWGADSVRVGIGGGSICSTRTQTGHGVPTLQSIIDCAASDRDVLLVADGGIRNSGDIVKALAAGADFIMLGSLLAGTKETPGDEIFDSTRNQYLKTYRGMASIEAQIDWRGHASSVEGVSTIIEAKGPVKDILASLECGIKSGLSYSGATSILELQAKSRFILQSSAGVIESSTHIMSK